jgi:hypothetical protein
MLDPAQMRFTEYNHVVKARAGHTRTGCIGKSMMPAMFAKSSNLLTRASSCR